MKIEQTSRIHILIVRFILDKNKNCCKRMSVQSDNTVSSFMSVGQAEVLPDLLPSLGMKTQIGIDDIDTSTVGMKDQTGIDNTEASPEGPSPIPDLKSGYLLKKGTMGLLTKRFFEINGEYLLYYKNKKKRKLIEAISIAGAANIRTWDVSSKKEGLVSSLNKTILIDLRDRQYILLAETVEDCKSWIHELLSIREAEHMRSKFLEAIDSLSIIDDLDGNTNSEDRAIFSLTRSRRSSSIEKERRIFLESVNFDHYSENDKWNTINTSEESKIEDFKSYRDSIYGDEIAETEKITSIPESRKGYSFCCCSFLFSRKADIKAIG